MKKKIIAMMMSMVLGASMLAGCGEAVETPKLEGSCADILNQVYENAELDADFREALSYYELTTISEETEEYILGTDEVDYIDSAYSAPMMSSVAYQCVVLRLEPDEDVLKAKQDLIDHADPIKWICVEAEEVVVENVGDVVLYVMADQQTADAIKTAFLALSDSQNAN